MTGPTLLEGIHEYFWQSFQDSAAKGDFTQPVWTLRFMEKPYWAALTEELDVDLSGLLSVAEVNHFTDRKPDNITCVIHFPAQSNFSQPLFSLAEYLAVTALRRSYETSQYAKIISKE